MLRGGLSESEKAKVMEHIAKCDECADRMADLTLDMACVDPPAGMNEDILAAAAKEKIVDVVDVNGNGEIDLEDFIILGLRTPGIRCGRHV